MDARALQQDRIDACSFMVMTADGPVSMCKHNAERDEHILKPLVYTDRHGQVKQYQPLGERYKQNNIIPIRQISDTTTPSSLSAKALTARDKRHHPAKSV